MKGFKGFNSDMTCRGFQYEIGKTFETDEDVRLCSSGFHFCDSLGKCFDFYDKFKCRFCEIDTEDGDTQAGGSGMFVTNKITIVREIPRKEINRFIYGNGDGNGDGYGDGNGNGYGYGDGYGDSYGDGYGYGNGDGNGDGYGYGDIQRILVFTEV